MRFSQYYNIKDLEEFNFFDCDLFIDTKLFIDPFLIFQDEDESFSLVHDKLINFFNVAFKLAIKSSGDKQSNSYKKLNNMLLFPEIDELALGYAGESTKGQGSGTGFRDIMIKAIFLSIKSEITSYSHFEEIGILSEGIGCDRISDICANIIKSELITYTQKICELYEIPMSIFRVEHAEFNFEYLRWETKHVLLPANSYNKKPIILVPKRFLDELPIISSDKFWDYIWDNKNEILRNDFNFELKSKINKSDIIELARRNPNWVKDFIEYQESKKHSYYDFDRDKSGLYQWSQKTSDYVRENCVKINVTNKSDFFVFIKYITDEYKRFVEDNSGYKLLWDDKTNRGKKESATQLLFYGIAKSYCIANDIDITRESNLGSGPVDFKFSQGYKNRVLIEVKLARNGKFWNGLIKQLPQYMRAEGIGKGIFLVVVYKDEEHKKISEIQNILKDVTQETKYDIDCMIIDAVPNKLSASKL